MQKFYKRAIDKRIDKVIDGFPVIFLTGPRQSGKTTYIKHRFKTYKYFNLESFSDFEYISNDPEHFFKEHPKNIIIDEVQRMPELLSYIQVHVDNKQEMGSIILSGSQNLLISEKISQSLAGRVAHLTLLPFSLEEIKKSKIINSNVWQQTLKGFYPALYSRNIPIDEFYNSYLATFVERDVRLIKNIGSLTQFKKFMILLAGRVGQVVNISSLADDTGISPNTAESWLSILEASYVIFRLPPYFKNVSKRLVRSPKIFFYDTGLLCFLLSIDSVKELDKHFARGDIFENLIITEVKKNKAINDISSQLYFYRSAKNEEVDLIIDSGKEAILVEIKSATNFSQSFLSTLLKVNDEIFSSDKNFVVYSGSKILNLKQAKVLPWDKLDKLK
jgi:predicted AAA+ superfamily ATPase